MSPARWRVAVSHLQCTLEVSERFACRVGGQRRSTPRHTPASQPVAKVTIGDWNEVYHHD